MGMMARMIMRRIIGKIMDKISVFGYHGHCVLLCYISDFVHGERGLKNIWEEACFLFWTSLFFSELWFYDHDFMKLMMMNGMNGWWWR